MNINFIRSCFFIILANIDLRYGERALNLTPQEHEQSFRISVTLPQKVTNFFRGWWPNFQKWLLHVKKKVPSRNSLIFLSFSLQFYSGYKLKLKFIRLVLSMKI